MIEDEQRVQLPRLLQNALDGNVLKEQARLHPSKLSPTLRMQPLSTATMIIPEEDPEIVMHDWMELYNQHGSCGIFRVVDIQPAYGKNRSITLNHALDILNDAVYPSNTEEFDGTVTAYLTKLLGAQKQKIGNTPYWQLGTVADTGNWHQEFNYDNILELIKEVTTEHEDYYYTFDFSVFPWRLNLVARNDDVLTEFRASRNIESCKVTQNDSDQCTRLYLSITTKAVVTEGGRTAGKKSTVTFEVHDDQQGQATWGVIEKTAGIETDKVPAAEKAAWVQGYFERHRDPAVQITIDGYDLKEQTGESIDEMHLARVCRAILPRYNTTLLERIVEVTYPDALRQPSRVSVSMANKRQTTEDNIASAQKEAKKAGGGGGAAKRQAENNATEIEFQKIRYDLQVVKDEKRFAIIASESWYEQMEGGSETLVGQYTANVETTARKLTSAFNVTGVTLDANGNPVTDGNGNYVFSGGNNSLHSQVTQTAAAITSEVTRAQGAETTLSSTITQTASSIRSEVSAVDGRVSSLELTVDGITLSGNTITIKGNSINLTGVVYADDLNAVDAKISNLVSGVTTATLLKTNTLQCTSLSFNGDSARWGTISLGSLKSMTVMSHSIENKDFDHYHGITLTESNGTVTATIGAAQSSAGTDSFNMAATTWYAGQVTAFKSAVSSALGSAGWNGASGKSTQIYASFDGSTKKIKVNSAAATITYPGDQSSTSVSISIGDLDISTALDAYVATLTPPTDWQLNYQGGTNYTYKAKAKVNGTWYESGDLSAANAYDNGWTGAYGTVGISPSSAQTINPGGSVTVYAQAKATSGAPSKTNVASVVVSAASASIDSIVKSGTATYSANYKTVYVPVKASGTNVSDYTDTVSCDITTAFNKGVEAGEGKFSLASVTLQGSAHASITPVSGSSVYCYETSSVTVTPISGSAVKLKYSANVQHYVKNGSNYDPVGGVRSWYYVDSGGTAYYKAGSDVTYYTRSNGAYRYKAGTAITGLYYGGSTVSDTYYTKS